MLSLTLDRNPRFISGILKILCKIFSISVSLSTLFPLNRDKQSEIGNEKIEKYPCTFVNNQQDNKSDKLVIARFARNNNHSVSIKLFPWFARKNLYLHISFDIAHLFNITTDKQMEKKTASDISETMQSI